MPSYKRDGQVEVAFASQKQHSRLPDGQEKDYYSPAFKVCSTDDAKMS